MRAYQNEIPTRFAAGEAPATTVAPDVVAQPVYQTVQPDVVNTTEAQLLRGLEALNPALGILNQQLAQAAHVQAVKERVQAEGQASIRGVTDALRGELAEPQEASPKYQESFMTVRGQMAASQAQAALAARVQKEWNNPDFDLDKIAGDMFREDTKGAKDTNWLNGYQTRYLQHVESLKTAVAAKQLQEQRQQSQETLAYRATELADSTTSDEGYMQERLELLQWGRAQGMAGEDIAKMVAQAAINKALQEQNLDPLRRLHFKVNGVATADHPEIAGAIRGAVETITKNKAAEHVQDFDTIAATQRATFQQTLKTNPGSFGATPEEVAANLARFVGPKGTGKPFTTQAEYESAVAQVIDAQLSKKAEPDPIQFDLNPGLYSGTTEGKEILKQRFAAIWDPAIASKNPEKIREAVARSQQLSQASQVADPHLAGIMHVRGMSKEQAGNFRIALDIYETHMMNGTSPLGVDETDLGILGMASKLMRQGNTFEEAMDKSIRTQAAGAAEKARLTPTESHSLERAAEKLEQRTWFIFGHTAANPKRHTADFRFEVMQKVQNGIDVDTAIEQTETAMKQRLAWDGHDNYILLPQQLASERDSVEAGMKRIIQDTRDSFPTLKDSALRVDTSPDGRLFFVMDQENRPIATVPIADVRQAARREKYASPEEIMAGQAISQRIRAGQVPKEEALRLNAQDLYNKGLINSLQYDRIRTAQRAEGLRRANEAIGLVGKLTAAYGVKNAPPATMDEIVNMNAPVGRQADATAPDRRIMAREALGKQDLTLALTMLTEGFTLTPKMDPNGDQMNIGCGYGITIRPEAIVAADLRKAGVPPGEVKSVIAGKTALKPEQAALLTSNVLKNEYMPKAKADVEQILGPGAWSLLAPNQKAVFTYLAYNTGSAAKFPTVIKAVAAGDLEKATEHLRLTYIPKGSTQRVYMQRATSILRAMLAGEQQFSAIIDKT